MILTFKRWLQVPIPPLSWDSIYKHAGRPLAIDIGCGKPFAQAVMWSAQTDPSYPFEGYLVHMLLQHQYLMSVSVRSDM